MKNKISKYLINILSQLKLHKDVVVNIIVVTVVLKIVAKDTYCAHLK